ncbi:prolipoprotein diacylglyceryl transferase [Acidicapsa dinghuensis]|uniref:Phosphatidylglycerol--prolipoprotein diacylglyceryl transferase n=1 Tax=Acidicapsa dinghuensis TaxID=2218256 RepID=A0ABW1EN69_9BACT|nr:prolipoprotein diacylglyceryl transferase [Acidicapsa dinghuensis]
MLPYIHIGIHFVLHFGSSVIPVGPWDVPTFGLMLWVATICGAWVLHKSFQREHIEADALGIVALSVVAGIIGAKLWHVIDTPEEFQIDGWRALISTGGFAWFGGLVGGILALIIQGKKAGLSALRMLDLASPAAAVGYAIGRIGCLTSGDGDYGVPSKLPWAMGFPNGIDPTPPGVRVHPTPLYECIVGLLIAWWLWKRASRHLPIGEVVGEYLLWTGLARFLVEFIRRNPRILFGLSNAQLASVGSVIAGAALIWLAMRRRKTAPESPEEAAGPA